MGQKKYDLFIDESGDFNDAAGQGKPFRSMSLVGGILVEQGQLTNELVMKLLPEPVHCCESYEKRYLDVLDEMRQAEAKFIIFQNREQIQIVNGDTTYLNILAEGLVQLFQDLKLNYPKDTVHVNVQIAVRKNMTAESGIIAAEEYIKRVDEKVQLTKYRKKAEICEYELHFGDARKIRQFDLADIICNTFFTKNGTRKFTDEDRTRIEQLYDKHHIYSVFEGATVGYLKQLLSEGHYSEMICQICSQPNLQGVEDLHEKLLEQLISVTATEREVYFKNLSLQIRLYIEQRAFMDGIAFAKNYKQHILFRLQAASEAIKKEVAFWIFDTDFYLVTMYNHIGAVSKCAEYLKLCNDNIHAVNHSWEHIDYYFNFRIRELNCLKGCFDFETVLKKAERLIQVFSSAKELFEMIDADGGTTGEIKSELLGKAYGIQVEIYMNLIRNHPKLLEKAEEASEASMNEFSAKSDLQRQYQNRCALLLAAKKPREALDWLLRVFDLNAADKDALNAFMGCVYQKPKSPLQFPLYHYTSVMAALGQDDLQLGQRMFDALQRSGDFQEDIKNNEADNAGDGYPRNLTLWNISRWHDMNGNARAAGEYLNRAVKITKKNPDKITMYSFSISMEAEGLLRRVQKGVLKENKARAEIDRIMNDFCGRADVPDTMKRHFMQCSDDNLTKYLMNLGCAYLK